MANWKFVVNLPKDEVIELAKKCSSEGYYVEYSIPCDYIIPIEWIKSRIDTILDSYPDGNEETEILCKLLYEWELGK